MTLLSKNEIAEWNAGMCTDAFTKLGTHDTDDGFRFAVWAPHAKSVNVVGDFNEWNKRTHPMKKNEDTGIWQAFIPAAQSGQCYKFSITSQKDKTVMKSDPYGYFHEHEGQHASIIYDLPEFDWDDSSWMQNRLSVQEKNQPLSIYEVHIGSWRRTPSGEFLSYAALADTLIPYVKEMGFTHIELLPVMEHPYGPSWGYQGTGYYAPTSRYGKPEEFMAFVDACHQHNIGIILDWVPGHFPRDEHGLAFFDGTALYEHSDRRRREHADWGTNNFDFGKPGVRNFLLSNAFFWCEKFHIDGFRVDAVASMLYLNYSKGEGDWLPNVHGGKENLGALSFLKDFNSLIKQHDPSFLTIAEESTTWPGVTQPVDEGGLGFDYKWNMGWMNDTLQFFESSFEERLHRSHSITFPVTFAFSERFILPFSHDEVVHLKKSLWAKMPGSPDQKFRQLKQLFLFMIAYPGKKLLFMGNEFADKEEWSEGRGLDWSLLDNDQNNEIRRFAAALLSFYRTAPALYEQDHTGDGFRWVDLSHKEKAVYAFSRTSRSGEKLVFIFNFSLHAFEGAHLAVDWDNCSYNLLIDTLQAGNDKDKVQLKKSFPVKPLQGIVLERKNK